uniref:F-box protein n=1 Tax=Chenopodium quinoa TaxID=63459 RepID=A0A803MHC3_CHEQI
MDVLQPDSKCPRTSAVLDDNTEPDYFGKLHDDLLIEILDKLPMEVAMDTSLLSKSWKDLWKHKRNVELGQKWVQNCDFNDRNDNRIKWRRRYPLVDMPNWVYSPCSSLVKLILISLQLNTLPPLHFKALRELYLEHVKLTKDSVEKITSNCPSLGLLSLSNCNPTTGLNINVAANSSLLHLVVNEEFTDVRNATELCIRAPNVKTIEFASALPRKSYRMDGTLACSEAIFRLDKMHHRPQAIRIFSSGLKGYYAKNFLGLLRKLATAKVLTVSSWCIQVLSMEVYNFRKPLTFEASHLILETGLCRWEFQGIAYMLLGCYKLENLTIVMGDPAHLNAICQVRNPGVQFDNILQQLETIEFKYYSATYQTWDGDDFNESLFFAVSDFGRLLAWNLKTYADNLKKVVFSTRQKHFASDQFRSIEALSTFKKLYQCHLPCVYRNPTDRCHPALIGVNFHLRNGSDRCKLSTFGMMLCAMGSCSSFVLEFSLDYRQRV